VLRPGRGELDDVVAQLPEAGAASDQLRRSDVFIPVLGGGEDPSIMLSRPNGEISARIESSHVRGAAAATKVTSSSSAFSSGLV
jgi:hypothetical protein